MVIHTDASLLGWGQALNVLELLGAKYACQAFCQNKRDLSALLWIDNTSAIAYINHIGGTRSSDLAKQSIEFWEWALERGIVL